MSSAGRVQRAMGGAGARHQGFTLIEMVMTMAVLVVLVGIAVPTFRDALLGSRLNTSAHSLVSSVQLARSEAMKRNAVVTLCASTNGTSCSNTGWERGWIVRIGAIVILRQEAMPTGFTVTSSGGSTLSFQPTGVGSTQTTFTACRATPTVGNQERVITVSTTGRPKVTRTQTGVCP